MNFQISRAIYIRFSIFPMWAHFSQMYVHSFSNIAFFLFVRGIKVRSVLRGLAIVCCRKKWIEEYASNFVSKCSKTLKMLKLAYVECTVSQESVYKWYKLFTEGREEVNDDARPGRPNTSTTNENTEAVKKIVNRRITIREVAEDDGISVGSCHAIFSDIFGLKRVAAKFVPKLLNFDQKTRRMTIAQEMLNDVNDDPDLLKKVITGDESWVYMVMTSKPKPNRPNGSSLNHQDRKKPVKFGQRSRFCSLFSLIIMA